MTTVHSGLDLNIKNPLMPDFLEKQLDLFMLSTCCGMLWYVILVEVYEEWLTLMCG